MAVAVPIQDKWKAPEDIEDVANDVSRISVFVDVPGIHSKFLAAIVGWQRNICGMNQSEVNKIDVQCKKMNLVFGKYVIQQYDESSSLNDKLQYNDRMFNSTFGFCPWNCLECLH